MANESFTVQELDVLFEAVEQWERGNPTEGMAEAMMAHLMTDKVPEEVRVKMEADMRKNAQKREEAERMRKERGVLLRAKLVMIKQAMAVQKFCEEGSGA